MKIKSLPERIRSRRMELNLTQEQLAEQTDIDLMVIQALEKGAAELISLEPAYKLAHALNESMICFFPTYILENLSPIDSLLLKLNDLDDEDIADLMEFISKYKLENKK